jgi:hypothetical protein
MLRPQETVGAQHDRRNDSRIIFNLLPSIRRDIHRRSIEPVSWLRVLTVAQQSVTTPRNGSWHKKAATTPPQIAQPRRYRKTGRSTTHSAEHIGCSDRGQTEHAPGAPAECREKIDQFGIGQVVLHIVRLTDPLECHAIERRVSLRLCCQGCGDCLNRSLRGGCCVEWSLMRARQYCRRGCLDE